MVEHFGCAVFAGVPEQIAPVFGGLCKMHGVLFVHIKAESQNAGGEIPHGCGHRNAHDLQPQHDDEQIVEQDVHRPAQQRADQPHFRGAACHIEKLEDGRENCEGRRPD